MLSIEAPQPSRRTPPPPCLQQLPRPKEQQLQACPGGERGPPRQGQGREEACTTAPLPPRALATFCTSCRSRVSLLTVSISIAIARLRRALLPSGSPSDTPSDSRRSRPQQPEHALRASRRPQASRVGEGVRRNRLALGEPIQKRTHKAGGAVRCGAVRCGAVRCGAVRLLVWCGLRP
jgi:hypothetical protein